MTVRCFKFDFNGAASWLHYGPDILIHYIYAIAAYLPQYID